MSLSPKKERRLSMQGFSCSVDSRIAGIEGWLRFTPVLNTVWILLGTIYASPAILWLFAIVTGIGSQRNYHLFDWVYNSWIRRYTRTGLLPANPKPRRFSMLLAAMWGVLTGLLFSLGFTTAGYVSGLLLASAALLVATTHFCLGSWLYRALKRGRFNVVD